MIYYHLNAAAKYKEMYGLKILDLSGNKIKSLPNSSFNLENLIALLLHECEHLKKVPSFSKLGF